jgi:cell fate (sporulation/competence/biofilm development) regulator YlbF (YheA/YmcA/DUF963 family)
MSVMEQKALDTATVLMEASDLGDWINHSAEMANYLFWKDAVSNHPEVPELVAKLDRQKELFEECQRFGHFHPEYHKAMEAVQRIQHELEQIEPVARYKEAEHALDELLYDVSKTIAHAVSETIKVPSNNPLPHEGGCSTGGSCSGGCG